MTITVKLPDGSTAQFPDGTPPATMQAAIQKKFPPTGAQPAPGPTAPAPSTMSGIPSQTSPTPASAAVTDMTAPQPAQAPQGGPAPLPTQPGGGQPSPGANGGVSADALSQANALALSQAPLPIQAANFLASVGSAFMKDPVGNVTAFGRSATQALPVVGAPLSNLEDHMSAGLNSLAGSGPTDPAAMGQRFQQIQSANPAAATAGTIAGTVAPALIPGVGEAAEAIPAFGLAGGAANVARAAIAGGTIAGADTLTRTGNLGDAATNAAIGAVAGPVVGKVVGAGLGAARAMSAPAAKAWAYIAKKIAVDPADLQAFIAAHRMLTGQQPSIQQVLDANSAGAVKDFAQNNPQAAMILQQGQAASAAALPAQAAGAVERGGMQAPTPTFISGIAADAQHPQGLLDTRDRSMDQAMGAMRNTGVSLPEDLRGDPDLQNALTGRNFRGVRERLDNDELTIGDVDQIRQQLNAVSQNHPAGPGSPFAQLSNELVEEARQQVPQYAAALDEYGSASRYIQGFNHSYSGGAPAETATDAGVRRALATPEGAQGHAAGVVTNIRNRAGSSPSGAVSTLQDIATPGDTQRAFQGAATGNTGGATDRAQALLDQQQSVARSTPTSVSPPNGLNAAGNLAAAGVEGAAGLHLSAISRLSRSVTSFLKHSTFAPAVQRAIANGLTSRDPAVRDAMIERLRSANVAESDLKNLQTVIAGVAGGKSSAAMDDTRG